MKKALVVRFNNDDGIRTIDAHVSLVPEPADHEVLNIEAGYKAIEYDEMPPLPVSSPFETFTGIFGSNVPVDMKVIGAIILGVMHTYGCDYVIHLN